MYSRGCCLKGTDEEIVKFLKEDCHYPAVKILGEGRYAAIYPFIYTHAIILVTRRGYDTGYEDRWCYHTYEDALVAMAVWDGTGEPKGWHRHPSSGRRRDENGKEYINP